MTRTVTLIIAFCVAALGCKEPARAVPPAPPEAAVEEAAVETPPPAFQAAPEEPPAQTCGADHQKDDARLRLEHEKMHPILTRVRFEGELAGFIEGIRDAARRKAFGEMAGVIEGTLEEMERLSKGASDNLRPLLERSVKARAGAYATCMSLADDDISWCTALDDAWTGERAACQVMHTAHRRIAVGAVRGGADCASAMAGSPETIGLSEKDWVAMCQAVKDMKPETCPAGIEARVEAMCKAAAARSGREHCKLLEEEHSPVWEPCCVKFAYRLGGVIVGKAAPGLLPELAAIEGDRDGCERALAWGVFQDTAWIFGVEGVPDSPLKDNDSDDYLCLFQVYHSVEKLPGE
ncbi:MAG: hypothetical protein JRG91_03220 [Deltaproteobacteria bacterium]|nr:hypothetical protein [Deltaproteobacteria bacterium]